jgi:nitronate monooxygenase
VTRVFTGRLAQGLRNHFVEEYRSAGSEPLVWPLQRAAAGDIYGASQAADDGDYSPLLAGQGLRMLKEEGQGAAEIVDEIVAEAGVVLSRLGGASSGTSAT